MNQLDFPIDHELVQVRRGRRSGLPVIICVHSTVLGPALGALTIRSFPDAKEALTDCLRRSQTMTYKAAAVDNGTGGASCCVPFPYGAEIARALRLAAMLDIADEVHALNGLFRVIPGPGIEPEEMDVLFRRTPWISGRSRRTGGVGATLPGGLTGLKTAINTAIACSLDRSSVSGVRICILGLDEIGAQLARDLRKLGAQLVLSDMDPTAQLVAVELGVEWLPPEEAIRAECDVLVPCVGERFFTSANVSELNCRIICGSANGQLSSPDVGASLVERGIDYVPDFIANAGDLIYLSSVELDQRTEAAAVTHVRFAMERGVRSILTDSREATLSSVELAIMIGRHRIDSLTPESD